MDSGVLGPSQSTPSPNEALGPQGEGNNATSRLIVGCIVGGLVGTFVIAFVLFLVMRRSVRRENLRNLDACKRSNAQRRRVPRYAPRPLPQNPRPAPHVPKTPPNKGEQLYHYVPNLPYKKASPKSSPVRSPEMQEWYYEEKNFGDRYENPFDDNLIERPSPIAISPRKSQKSAEYPYYHYGPDTEYGNIRIAPPIR